MKRRFLSLVCFVLSAVLLFPLSGIPAVAAAPNAVGARIADVRVEVGTSARAAVLMEEASGLFLYEKNAELRLPMASTTKIMTALVALENADPDLLISVPREAVGTEGSSVYLFEGEQLTLEALLWALLLASANDAAVAIACGVAGGVAEFAGLMNQKAEALGLQNTHFTNPHGLDDEEHYTTAHDLALITRAALQNPLIRTITATRKKTIPHNGADGVRLLVNHNKLLKSYPGAIGVKTGFTKRSGRCLVSAAEREGLCLIAVTLDAPSDWSDHRALLDAGFSALSAVLLAKEGEFSLSLPVVGGVTDAVTVYNPETANILLPALHGGITATVELPRFLYAGVAEGQTVGYVVWRMDGEPIAKTPLVTGRGVEKQKRPNWFLRLWQKIFH